MKPKIYFSYEDSRWLKPVTEKILVEIKKHFEEHPEYKQKFDTAEVELPPSITNCWLDLPEEKEGEFRATLQKLPTRYTMDEFWKVAKEYEKYVAVNPPTRYLLNLLAYPWDVDDKYDLIYFDWDLSKL